MRITQKLCMDLARAGCKPIVAAVQGEGNTRVLEIDLYDKGVAWELPAGTTAAVAFQKPDGTKGLYDKLPNGDPATTISGSTVTAILAPQVLTCAGIVLASVVFYDADQDVLATYPFKIAVEVNPAAGVQLSEDYYTLQTLDQINMAYALLLGRVEALEERGGSPDNGVGGLGGVGVVIDATLTQSGQAADAKAVGDALKSLVPAGTVEPAETDIPKVFLTGKEFSNMNNSKNEVKMKMEYVSKTERFLSSIKIKFQGNSSLAYAKKNFTVKMYTDDTYDEKLKKTFKDWGVKQNKYVLKANFIDHTHARNIVCANLWSDVIDSRSDYAALPKELRNSPRNGAIDGFPIKLYVNGTYQGIYTWNIGKDDWMWGMDEDNANHVLLCAETNAKTANPCNFNALWGGTDGTNWSVEVGTNSNAVKTALNNMIQFIMDNDGDAFKAGIGEYLDIQSAIDYYLHALVICGPDNIAKNMLIGTYDCTKWRLGVYDMDSVLGLWWTGRTFISASYDIYNDAGANAPDSLLWQRIEELYRDELKSRYQELRETVYSFGNMTTCFERFMDRIGLDLYAEDLTVYSIPSGNTNNIKQIRDYIRDRLAYTDDYIANLGNPNYEPEPDEPEPEEPKEPAPDLSVVEYKPSTELPNGYEVLVIYENTDFIIPTFSGNPSGVYGGTHIELAFDFANYGLGIVSPNEFTESKVSDQNSKGKTFIYWYHTYNNKLYLDISLPTADVGTTVESVKEWLASNRIAFYLELPPDDSITSMDGYEVVRVIDGSEITHGCGTFNTPPYSDEVGNRAAYTQFDIAIESGYTYKFVFDSDISTAQMALAFFNENVVNAVTNNAGIQKTDLDDVGWQSNGYEYTVPDTINGSPVAGVRLVFRADTGNSSVPAGLIKGVTIGRKLAE